MRISAYKLGDFLRISFSTIIALALCVQSSIASAEASADLQEELESTVARIDAIASDRTCDDTQQCASLLVGHTGCGRYVTYSEALGHEAKVELLVLAERSSELQKQISEAEFSIWACSMQSPRPLFCSAGQCVELSASFSDENVASAGEFLASAIYANQLNELSDRLSKREISRATMQKVLFRSALRISKCVLDDLTSDPESKAEPYVEALTSGYDDDEIRERLVAIHDTQIADEQIALVQPLLDFCIESEEMFVLGTYPRM